STVNVDPVIADAASDTAKATTLATSCGSTMRPSGYHFRSCSQIFGLCFSRCAQACVRTEPGTTVSTRMPYWPYSTAIMRLTCIGDDIAARDVHDDATTSLLHGEQEAPCDEVGASEVYVQCGVPIAFGGRLEVRGIGNACFVHDNAYFTASQHSFGHGRNL